VANEAKNTRRAHQRHLLRTSEEARGDDLPAADPGPELRLIARERSAWLVSNINALSEEDRLVIYCRYALDLTEAEMAGVLGCARGTVKSRLHRAIGRLRARLGPEIRDIDDRMVEERP
jgi:RNA polymerase sigma-70 factor (ECF subfamily)